MEFTIKLTFVEIYCEKIRDLLEPLSNNIRIKELPSGELVLSGVTEVYVTSEQVSVMRVECVSNAVPTLQEATTPGASSVRKFHPSYPNPPSKLISATRHHSLVTGGLLRDAHWQGEPSNGADVNERRVFPVSLSLYDYRGAA